MAIIFYKKIKYFNCLDILTFLYIFITGLIIIYGFQKINNFEQHLLVRLIFIIICISLIYFNNRYNSNILQFLRYTYPVFFLLYFYGETYFLNNVFFNYFDNIIIRIESKLFGFLPSEVFHTQFHAKWICELMHLGYFSFYLIIAFLVLTYYYQFPYLYEKRMFSFLFSFYLYYIIFILFPTAGPQFYIQTPEQLPQGYIFTNIVQKIIEKGDNPTGAFPSSHVGMTCIIMFFLFKDFKKAFILWLPIAIILILSTVYIRAHYAIDVLASLIIFPWFIILSEKFYLLLYTSDYQLEESYISIKKSNNN